MQVAVVTRAAALSVGPRHWCKLGDGGWSLADIPAEGTAAGALRWGRKWRVSGSAKSPMCLGKSEGLGSNGK